MDYWDTSNAEAWKVYDATLQGSSAEILLIRQAVSLYAEAFNIVVDPAAPRAQAVRKGLVSHNFNTLKLSVDAATRGYYLQSIALLRNVYENWLAFWYVAKFPGEADRWLKPSWEERPPKAETMRNKIDHPDKESKLKLHDFYQELTRFDHTDPAAVLSRIEAVEGNLMIRVGVRYKDEDFAACAYALCLWIGNMLDVMSSIVPPENNWHQKYEAIGDQLLNYLNKYNENHPRK